MKKRARIVSGLAALAALFLAPLAEASLTRASSPAIEQSAPALTLAATAPEPSEFSLFDGTELTAAADESERAPSFHPLAAVSLLSKDGAEAPLVSADELIYPKTHYRVFGLLGTPILGELRGVSLEMHWGSASFSCGIASGTVGWLSQDPMEDKDSPNLYGFVGARPHELTDPLGLESNRQLIGLDTADEDIRQGNLLKGYGKKAGYGLWNILTFGFVERHDRAFEKYEKTGDTAGYIADTTKEVVRAGAVGAASIASGGVAGVGARTLASGIVRGAAAGAVSSLAGTAAGDVVDRAYGEKGATTGDYVASAVGGALFGGASGAFGFALAPRSAPALTNGFARAAGGTGRAYDKTLGQGLYMLFDETGPRYIGRGDAAARIARHALDAEKGQLSARILFENNLRRAEARGLEQALMDALGGPMSGAQGGLLNRINGISIFNPKRGFYADAAAPLLDELFKRAGK